MCSPKYIPVGPAGQTGPAFDFATMACAWIIQQEKPSAWTWETREPVKPAETLGSVMVDIVRAGAGMGPIVGKDGMTLSPDPDSESGRALAAYYDRGTYTGD